MTRRLSTVARLIPVKLDDSIVSQDLQSLHFRLFNLKKKLKNCDCHNHMKTFKSLEVQLPKHVKFWGCILHAWGMYAMCDFSVLFCFSPKEQTSDLFVDTVKPGLWTHSIWTYKNEKRLLFFFFFFFFLNLIRKTRHQAHHPDTWVGLVGGEVASQNRIWACSLSILSPVT